MKTAVCLLALFCCAAHAENKPDLSGRWKLNLGKSVLGPIPAPALLVRTVVYSDPSLTVTEEQKGGSGDHVSIRHYTTDGKQVSFQENGANIIATAVWEGTALRITANADAGGTTIAFTETMTLSDAGKTLTDVLHIVTPQGEMNARYIFEKQ